jgi:hypothetical protein
MGTCTGESTSTSTAGEMMGLPERTRKVQVGDKILEVSPVSLLFQMLALDGATR